MSELTSTLASSSRVFVSGGALSGATSDEGPNDRDAGTPPATPTPVLPNGTPPSGERFIYDRTGLWPASPPVVGRTIDLTV